MADSLPRERALPRNAETCPTNQEPSRPSAKAEEGAVVFSLVQHAQDWCAYAGLQRSKGQI